MKVLLFVALWLVTGAQAQELTFLGGNTKSDEPRERSFGWALSYSHELSPHFSASLTYQNEGHLPGHHRDGFAAQLWAKTSLLSPQLSIAAGIGPYRYFDTQPAANAAGYVDRNGWGTMASLAATWRASASPWLYQLRVHRISVRHDIHTTALYAGVGYRLERDAQEFAAQSRKTELTAFLGRSIVNSLESETATAKSLELRHAFGPSLRGTVAWLHEGDSGVVHRRGVAVQGWLEPSFSGDRFTLGAGFGPYFAKDARRAGKGSFTAGLASLTASYRLGRDWTARLTVNRVISGYDRDSDVILLGLGYRF